MSTKFWAVECGSMNVTEVTEWRKVKSKDSSRRNMNTNQVWVTEPQKVSGIGGTSYLRKHGQRMCRLPDNQPHPVEPGREGEMKIWKNWIKKCRAQRMVGMWVMKREGLSESQYTEWRDCPALFLWAPGMLAARIIPPDRRRLGESSRNKQEGPGKNNDRY